MAIHSGDSTAGERPLELYSEDPSFVASGVSLHLSLSQIPLGKWEKGLPCRVWFQWSTEGGVTL